MLLEVSFSQIMIQNYLHCSPLNVPSPQLHAGRLTLDPLHLSDQRKLTYILKYDVFCHLAGRRRDWRTFILSSSEILVWSEKTICCWWKQSQKPFFNTDSKRLGNIVLDMEGNRRYHRDYRKVSQVKIGSSYFAPVGCLFCLFVFFSKWSTQVVQHLR